mmetsp:Transcript_15335/g.39474  ORF Transcript_15335/g.39474 Transcript_15335/m.39474 type:complete len:474 (-) Transcript_15335:179-1600(-)
MATKSLAVIFAAIAVALTSWNGRDERGGGVHAVPLPACPEVTPGLKATSRGTTQLNLEWISNVPFDAVIYWVNWEGSEEPAMVLSDGMTQYGGTFPGHAFRVRTYSNVLIKEYVVPDVPPGQTNIQVHVRPCGNMLERGKEGPALYADGMEEEYQALVHDQFAPCVGPSRNWSCIKRYTHEEYQARDPEKYGFNPGEGEAGRAASLIPKYRPHTDASYTTQIAAVPKVSAFGPGYLKMTIPNPLRDKLLTWYNVTKGSATPHEIVPGGYMNENKVHMHRLNLDYYSDIRLEIQKEMQSVMQWWTQMRLRHTSTYGVRIYRRNAMLINHVDRVDTHLASAVVQVAQTVDEDGGWPLEIMLGNKSVGEVYLQPGEMVLYEGAWLRHGRPMRFKGDEFANLFTHFSPMDWNGPPHHHPPHDKPLPPKYHGYSPWRCDTWADVPGSQGACTVTETMDSIAKQQMAAQGEPDPYSETE